MENTLKPRVIALHESALVLRDELVKVLGDPRCCSHVGPDKPLTLHELAGHIVKLALTPRLVLPDPSDTLALHALPVPRFEPIDAARPDKHWLVEQLREQTGHVLHPTFFGREIHTKFLHEAHRKALGLTSGMVTVDKALNGLMRLQHDIMHDAHAAFQKLADAYRGIEHHPGKHFIAPNPAQGARLSELEDIKERLMAHIFGLGKAPDQRADFEPTPGGEKHRIQPPWMSTRAM